jgi:hypothetical protein
MGKTKIVFILKIFSVDQKILFNFSKNSFSFLSCKPFSSLNFLLSNHRSLLDHRLKPPEFPSYFSPSIIFIRVKRRKHFLKKLNFLKDDFVENRLNKYSHVKCFHESQ